MNREMQSSLKLAESIRPAVHAASVNGQDVDTLGYDSAVVAIAVGAIVAAGNVTPKLQESDTGGGAGYTDVAAADLVGAFPAVLLTNQVHTLVGYRGRKRYLRVVGTLNSGTSVAFSATVILGHASIRPPE